MGGANLTPDIDVRCLHGGDALTKTEVEACISIWAAAGGSRNHNGWPPESLNYKIYKTNNIVPVDYDYRNATVAEQVELSLMYFRRDVKGADKCIAVLTQCYVNNYSEWVAAVKLLCSRSTPSKLP